MNYQQGFSLLEVLIALAILSFGLLGFAEAELWVLQTNRNTYFHSVAVNQINNMAEMFRSCVIKNQLEIGCVNNSSKEWQKENLAIFPKAQSHVMAFGSAWQIKLDWQTVGLGSKKYFSLQEIIQP